MCVTRMLSWTRTYVYMCTLPHAHVRGHPLPQVAVAKPGPTHSRCSDGTLRKLPAFSWVTPVLTSELGMWAMVGEEKTAPVCQSHPRAVSCVRGWGGGDPGMPPDPGCVYFPYIPGETGICPPRLARILAALSPPHGSPSSQAPMLTLPFGISLRLLSKSQQPPFRTPDILCCPPPKILMGPCFLGEPAPCPPAPGVPGLPSAASGLQRAGHSQRQQGRGEALGQVRGALTQGTVFSTGATQRTLSLWGSPGPPHAHPSQQQQQDPCPSHAP